MTICDEPRPEAECRTRAAVGLWCCGQAAILASYLAASGHQVPSAVLVAAAAAGTLISLAATVAATFAALQTWPDLGRRVAFRCAVLWFASGSCAIAWLVVWFVR